MIRVNCATLSEHLAGDALFGHVAGGFTGAIGKLDGFIAAAHEGTLFFNEIQSLAMQVQAQLLDVLQYGEFRIGSSKLCYADVRIIAATNEDPHQLIREKRLRLDLFQRLTCLNLHLPSLRHRLDDIAPLTNHFLAEYARENGQPDKSLTPRALYKLMDYSWPGNVRELRNVSAAPPPSPSARASRRLRSYSMTILPMPGLRRRDSQL